MKIQLETKMNLNEFSYLLSNDLKELYLNLINSLDKNNFILSHSDLTRKNILKNKNGIFCYKIEYCKSTQNQCRIIEDCKYWL